MRNSLVLLVTLVFAVPLTAAAQMTYRVKGTVKDNDGKPVAGAKVRAEALIGFRGEQFVGQKEFATTANAKGEWTLLGLTSGLWTFEATAADVVPHVIVLPINFTNRKPQSAVGGSFPWDLPLTVRRTTHPGLTAAATAAMAGKIDDTVASVGGMAADPDADLLCAAGEVALLVRQHGLAGAIFEQIVKQHPKHACGVRGIASSALMRSDLDTAARMLWTAIDLVPRDQRPALGAALKDLQAITATKQ